VIGAAFERAAHLARVGRGGKNIAGQKNYNSFVFNEIFEASTVL
jgi:hypothetical protein